jgi:hypothetical protein
MADLLDRIHAEIRERLDETRAAAREYELLEAALAALGEPAPVRRTRKPRAAPVEPPALSVAPAPAPEPTPPGAAEAPPAVAEAA